MGEKGLGTGNGGGNWELGTPCPPPQKGHSKIGKIKILIANVSLMKVKRSILQYFLSALSDY